MTAEQPVSIPGDTPRFRLKTLGELSLTVVNEVAEPRSIIVAGKTLALLAFLSVAPSRSASRGRLAELLWASSDPEGALQSLRQARSGLKRAAGAELIMVSGEMLLLHPRIETDRDEFTSHLAGNRLRAAVEIYDGPFCAAFAASGADDFERWVDVERASLRSQCAETLARLAAQSLSQARASEALSLGQRLAEVDEDDERSWRIRIEAFLLKQDDFGARMAVADCRVWLTGESREPSRTLRLLLERALEARAGEQSSASSPGIHPDLVGREEQFAAILGAWKTAAIGPGIVIVVLGASGLGKTRLLSDVRERLAANRARVAAVRALPADSGIRFSLASRLAAALAGLRGAAGLSERSASVLLGLNPALSAHFSTSLTASELAQPVIGYVEALDELLGVVSEEAPVAVLVDDLHWSDAESAQVLASLGERQGSRRLLLVFAMRDRIVGAPRAPTTAQVVRVSPLSDVEAEHLLGSIGRLAERFSDDWVERLTFASGGNPLLMLETLRLALAGGALGLSGGNWQVHDKVQLEAVCSLRSAIVDRLSQLIQSARELALLLAVAGRPLPTLALEREQLGCGTSIAGPLKDLEIRDVATLEPEGWVIAHDSVAETLISSAPAAELVVARERAARVMQGTGEPASLRGALQLFAELDRWDECAEIVSRLAFLNPQSRISPRERAQAAIAELSEPDARVQIRRRLGSGSGCPSDESWRSRDSSSQH